MSTEKIDKVKNSIKGGSKKADQPVVEAQPSVTMKLLAGVTPKSIFDKFKHDPLVCDCKDDKHHEVYADSNDETIVQCTTCKRALKFPAAKKK